MTTTDQRAVFCTTLNRIRAKGPCESGWRKLLAHLGKTKADDELLPFAAIVESNGMEDALWCCRSVDYDRVWRLYAVWCARQVQRLMADARSIAALDVAHAYASGMATRGELDFARAAAWAAAWAAASDAAWAAASDAAWAAARDAARDAARAAARDAAWDAAWDAARAAAWAAAWAAARDAQKAMFLRVVNAPSEEAAAQILLAAMPVKEAA
jgi:hypothetical protein